MIIPATGFVRGQLPYGKRFLLGHDSGGRRSRQLVNLRAIERPLAMMMSKRQKRRMGAQQRLKSHSRPGPLQTKYIVVIDYECTCDQGVGWNYENEIIEWPAVLVRAEDGEFVDEFHSFVRPTQNTSLSAFCTEFTGINQAQVDCAPVLEDVIHSFDEWIARHGLVFQPPGDVEFAIEAAENSFFLGADGPWDLKYFLEAECKRKGDILSALHTSKPYFQRWVNLRWLHSDFYGVPKMGLAGCLKYHKLTFEGRPHR